ncbi:MAG: DUF5666 domain-containing protein, partial [Steroidobacteraceae bacterium]
MAPSSSSSFDDNIPGASLAGLAAGDIVEVSGMRRADGDIQATRIEAKPAGTVCEVTGDLIEVRGNSVNAAGELVASSIELKRDD